MAKDPTADNLAVFRQQALIVARRKDQTAETLTQLRAENEVLEKQMGGGSFSNDARSTGHGKGSHHVPQGEEVKNNLLFIMFPPIDQSVDTCSYRITVFFLIERNKYLLNRLIYLY